MKRLILCALCACLFSSCASIDPETGVKLFMQDAEEMTYARNADGTTMFAATGLSTSKPLAAAGSVVTTLSAHQMILGAARQWFGAKNTEVVQTNVTSRHAATQAANTRLAEIQATKAAEAAALEAAALP